MEGERLVDILVQAVEYKGGSYSSGWRFDADGQRGIPVPNLDEYDAARVR